MHFCVIFIYYLTFTMTKGLIKFGGGGDLVEKN